MASMRDQLAVVDNPQGQRTALHVETLTPSKPLKVLRIRAVEDRTGLKKSTIYKRIAAGEFPEGFALGGGMRGWLESSIDDWILGTMHGTPATKSE